MSLQPSPMEKAIRTPLSNSTNDPRPQQVSSPSEIAAYKSLRRKISFQDVSTKSNNSSTSDPSDHSSIFEALLYTPNYSNENIDMTGRDGSLQKSASLDRQVFVTGGRTSSSQRNESWFQGHSTENAVHPASPVPLQSLHIPTPLSTIKEQPSLATLRPSRKASILTILSRKSSAPRLLSKLKSQHKKRSFSDMGPFTRNGANNTSSAASSMTNIAANVTALCPSQPPPERSPTPPGLPTFNTPAAVAFRLPRPQLPLRDRLGLTNTPAGIEYFRQTVALPKGVVMRGEGGVLVRGRWRAMESAHTGATRHHPGMNPRRTPDSNYHLRQSDAAAPRMNAVVASQNATPAVEERSSSPTPRSWIQVLGSGVLDLAHNLLPDHDANIAPETQRTPHSPSPPTPTVPPSQQELHPLYSSPMHSEPVYRNSSPRSFSQPPSTEKGKRSSTRPSISTMKREGKKWGKWKCKPSILHLVCCRAEKGEYDNLHHPRIASVTRPD